MQCQARNELLIPYQSADLSPKISTHIMKEEKGKTEGDKGSEQLGQ